MSSLVDVRQLLDFEIQASSFWKVFLFVSTAVCIIAFGVLLKYALFRARCLKFYPDQKLCFFNILGDLYKIPLWKSSRNGFSLSVFLLQLIDGMCHRYRSFGIYAFWIGYVPFFITTSAEAAEGVLSGTKVIEKSWSYNLMLHSWLGTGLLTSGGKKWKSRRKLLTPSFHFDILKEFLSVFNEQAQLLVKIFKQDTEAEFTEITEPLALCSLDIICETTMGVQVGAQMNSELQYVKSVSRLTQLAMERALCFWQWSDFIYSLLPSGREFKRHLDILHNFTRSIIQEKKGVLLRGGVDAKNRKRKALMDVLLEHHLEAKDFSEEDIREEVDTFTFEGHDTTAMGMSWALYLIGLYPEIQAKVHEELDQIFGEDGERHVATEDLHDLKYLECVLKESQRLYPSVPGFARHVNEDMEICGHPITKGSTLFVVPYMLHRNPKVFPEPEIFDPNRFLPEECANRHPYAYVPFSAGPRNCIGQRYAMMEEKVVVSTILRHYNLESLDPRDKIPAAAEVVLRPSKPLRIRIRPRDFSKKM